MKMKKLLCMLCTGIICVTAHAFPVCAEENSQTVTIDASEVKGNIKYDLGGVSLGGNAYSYSKPEVVKAVDKMIPCVRLEGITGSGYGIYDAKVGKYNFDKLFAEIDNIHEAGADIVANIFFMPTWLSGDKEGKMGEVWAAVPSDYVKWQKYVYDIVYNVNIANNGVRRIDYWEIWNEPSGNYFFSYWKAGKFNEFYSKTAQAIKMADPTAKIGGYADNPYYQDYVEWAEYQKEHNTEPDFISMHFYGDWLKDGYIHPERYAEYANKNAANMEKVFGKALPIIWSEWNLNAESGKAPMDTTASYMAHSLCEMQNNPYTEKALFFRVEMYGGGRAASLLDYSFNKLTPARVLEMFGRLEKEQVAGDAENGDMRVIASANEEKTRISAILSRHNTALREQTKRNTDIVIQNHNIDGEYSVYLYTEDLDTRDNTGSLYPCKVINGSVSAGEPIIIDAGYMRNYSVIFAEVAENTPGAPCTLPPEAEETVKPNPLGTVTIDFNNFTEDDAPVNGVIDGVDFGEGLWRAHSDKGHLRHGIYYTADGNEVTLPVRAGNILKSIQLAGSEKLNGTKVTLSSPGNEDVTADLNVFPKKIETNWVNETTEVTIRYDVRDLIAVDNIYYEPVFAPEPGENLLKDPGFETGTRIGWGVGNIIMGDEAKSGLYYLRIPPNTWSFNKVKGLKPDTEYRYTLWVRNEVKDDQAYMGVKEYGGAETMTSVKDKEGYVKLVKTFKTGADSTTANLYFGKNTGEGYTYIDDCELVEVIYAEEQNPDAAGGGAEFADIEGHWAENSIKALAAVGAVVGSSDNLFKPDILITRAEFLSMLERAVSLKQVKYSGVFSDVSETDWYAAIAETAYQNALIPDAMIKDDKLLPEQPLTREEMLAVTVNAAVTSFGKKIIDAQTPGFDDFYDTAEWARPFAATACELGLTAGVTPRTLAPKKTVSRAQAAVVIEKLINME